MSLVYKVTGTMSDPATQLVSPRLSFIGNIIKDVSGDLKDLVTEGAQKAVEKGVGKAADSAIKGLKKKLNIRL